MDYNKHQKIKETLNKVKVYRLPPIMSDAEADKLGGTFLDDSHYKLLIDHDADVYCLESGALIAKFRKNILSFKRCSAAYTALKKAPIQNDNRGLAAGFDPVKAAQHARDVGAQGYKREEGSNRYRFILKDGTLSNTFRANKVQSGIIGYMDRAARFPFCRMTAFNEKEFNKFRDAWPLIKEVDNHYKELCPEPYAKQRAIADNTPQDFVIRDTAFTTVTVNRNFRTACHKDAGDYPEGFGNLVVLEAGKYSGGNFVIPKWGVAFNPRTKDLLFADVHQWHGNTAIKRIGTKKYERISLVMYYRDKMQNCGTAEQERQRAAKHGAKGLGSVNPLKD